MEEKILTTNQAKLLESISKNKKLTRCFFFTGGTALSHFYLQHRLSEDLDFFSENEINSLDIKMWIKEISKESTTIKKIKQNTLSNQEIYYIHFPNEIVKVDFAYFPFPHIGKFTKFNMLRVSSMEDIAINKLQAIISRKRMRDYLDLYLIIKKLRWYISDLRQNYRLKFDVWLDPEEIATNFVNVLDAKDRPIFLGKVSQKEIVDFFLDQSIKLKKEILKK